MDLFRFMGISSCFSKVDPGFTRHCILYVCWLRQMSFVVYWKCATAVEAPPTLPPQGTWWDFYVSQWIENSKVGGTPGTSNETTGHIPPTRRANERGVPLTSILYLLHLPFGIKMSKTRSWNMFWNVRKYQNNYEVFRIIINDHMTVSQELCSPSNCRGDWNY